MREINLNGYIDEEVWFGDEITPEALHEVLYGVDNQMRDDVHICLNSYGGSCNAATRMFDDLRAYPGNVTITVSGTAASAATVLAMAANRLEMTPGSLFMIHDPIVGAIGNERELTEAIQLLKACKESILNVYGVRCRAARDDVSARMTATHWMDAQAALADGFIDGIADGVRIGSLLNSGEAHLVDRAEAEKKVQAWIDRKSVRLSRLVRTDDALESKKDTVPVIMQEELKEQPPDNLTVGESPVVASETPLPPEEEIPNEKTNPKMPEDSGTPVAQLHKRLGLIMPTRR